ncbi:hypothetical protein Leryth_022356 [Lithospermum erythrorhizon]|nr:hypothetical protein Leryth_022356 [Lithospermum erythrorhizon]
MKNGGGFNVFKKGLAYFICNKHIPKIDLNKEPEEDQEEIYLREVAMRRRLDLNKFPIDVSELHPNLEIEDVIATMLKIIYPYHY